MAKFGPTTTRQLPNASDGDGSDIGAFEVQETSPPTLSITTPANNTNYTTSATVPNPASGTASDASGIQSVTLVLYRSNLYGKTAGYWNGSTSTPIFNTPYNAATHEHLADSSDAFANWTLDLPTTLTPGQYYLKATATDGEGKTTSVTNVFYVNDTTPSVAITSPTEGQKFTTPPTQATGTAGDSDGISIVTVLLYSAVGNGTTPGYWNGSTTNPEYSLDYDPTVHEITATGTTNWTLALPTLRTSQYYVRATARDTAGNWKSVKHSFTILNDASPTVKITTPQNNKSYTTATVPTTASGTASDTDGIEAVTLLLYRYAGNGNTAGYWDGAGTATPAYTAPYHPAKHEIAASTSNAFANWTLALPTLGAGKYSLRATVRDSKGNTKTLTHVFTVTPAASSVATLTEPAAPTTTLTQSEALASSDSITLTFSGAVPASFGVSVNGQTRAGAKQHARWPEHHATLARRRVESRR